MFISHCHVGAIGFGGEQSNPKVGTLPNLEQILDTVGVEGAVVFAPFPSKGLGWGGKVVEKFEGPNEWLCEELRKYPNLVGFATINPKEPDASEKLKKIVKMGLVGAKVHPAVHKITINDLAIDEFFKTAEKLRIPIHIHTGVHGGFLRTYEPILIDDVMQRHPDLSIIMDHLGGYALFDQALAVLHNNKNSYVGLTQCSGRDPLYYLPKERVDILLKTVGVERIIYGFDYPWNKNNLLALKEDIKWIQSWDISKEDEEKILGGNLIRLLGGTKGITKQR